MSWRHILSSTPARKTPAPFQHAPLHRPRPIANLIAPIPSPASSAPAPTQPAAFPISEPYSQASPPTPILPSAQYTNGNSPKDLRLLPMLFSALPALLPQQTKSAMPLSQAI